MLNHRKILMLVILLNVMAPSYGYADEPDWLRLGGHVGALDASVSGRGTNDFDEFEARRSYQFFYLEGAYYRHDVLFAADLSLHVGASYVSKGPLATANDESLTYKYAYFEFPVLLRVTIPLYKRFAVYGAVGETFGVLRNAKLNGGDITDSAAPFDAGFTYAAGLNIPTWRSDWNIDIQYRRNHGHVNIDKNAPDIDATMNETRYLLVGLTYQKVRRDSDGDRVPDKKEAREDCILIPEDRDGFEDSDGCPDHDNDNDGIPDQQDQCKGNDTDYLKTREDHDGFEDGDGCPDADNDEDDILDDEDGPNGTCKDQAEDKDGFEDKDGCPDKDNDKDGVDDEVDGDDGKCKDQAEDRDGFEDEDGCPDPDNDGDELLDEVDQCPNTREIENGWQDADGCPDVIPLLIRQAELSDAKFSRQGGLIARSAAQGLVALLDQHKISLFSAKATFELVVVVYSTKQALVDANVEIARQATLGSLQRQVSKQASIGAENKPGKTWWAEHKDLVAKRLVFEGCLAPTAKATPLGRSRIEVQLRSPGTAQQDRCERPPSLRQRVDALSGAILTSKQYFLKTGALKRDRRGRLPNKTKQQFTPLVQVMSAYKGFGATVIAYASSKEIAGQTARGLIGDLKAMGVPAERLRTTPENWCKVDRGQQRIELSITWDGEQPVEVSCEQPPSQGKARLGALPCEACSWTGADSRARAQCRNQAKITEFV